MFHQMEGLVVDKGITLGDLQGALNTFVQKMFGADTRTRQMCISDSRMGRFWLNDYSARASWKAVVRDITPAKLKHCSVEQ